MARVKRGTHGRKKKREVLEREKGYRGASRRPFKTEKE
jgi:ribosomal protein L20